MNCYLESTNSTASKPLSASLKLEIIKLMRVSLQNKLVLFQTVICDIQVLLSLRTWPICLALEYGDQEHLLKSSVISFKLWKEGKVFFQFAVSMECHTINYFLTQHAQAVLGNIGPG